LRAAVKREAEGDPSSGPPPWGSGVEHQRGKVEGDDTRASSTMDRPPVANETALREIPSRFGESICLSSYLANPLSKNQH